MKYSLDRILALVIGLYLVVAMGGEIRTALFGLGAQMEGRVISSSLQRRGLTTEVTVLYEFRIGENVYQGQRINSAKYGYYLFAFDDPQDVLRQLPAGQRVLVNYQPSDPRRSFMTLVREPKKGGVHEVWVFLIGLLMAGWGLGLDKVFYMRPWIGGAYDENGVGIGMVGRDLEDTLKK